MRCDVSTTWPRPEVAGRIHVVRGGREHPLTDAADLGQRQCVHLVRHSSSILAGPVGGASASEPDFRHRSATGGMRCPGHRWIARYRPRDRPPVGRGRRHGGVFTCHTQSEAADTLVAEIAGLNGRAYAVQLDLAVPEQVADAFAAADGADGSSPSPWWARIGPARARPSTLPAKLPSNRSPVSHPANSATGASRPTPSRSARPTRASSGLASIRTKSAMWFSRSRRYQGRTLLFRSHLTPVLLRDRELQYVKWEGTIWHSTRTDDLMGEEVAKKRRIRSPGDR